MRVLLANRLRELRKANELSQGDMAEKLDMTTSAYGYYEQGKSKPSPETLSDIADIFGVTTDYLLGRSSNPKLSHKNEVDIQKDLEAMKENFNKGALQMQLDGEELDDEVIQYILDNLEDALTIAKIKSKEKFTPKKYKKWGLDLLLYKVRWFYAERRYYKTCQ